MNRLCCNIGVASQVEVVGLSAGTIGSWSEVDAARLEDFAAEVRHFERADFFELGSTVCAASRDAVSQSGEFFVEFGIGYAAHEFDFPMRAFASAASIHARRCRYSQSAEPGAGCAGFWFPFVLLLRQFS